MQKTMGKSKKRQDQSSADGVTNNNKSKRPKSAGKTISVDGRTDWLDSLVQKSVVGNDATILSKEDRKRKREAKKAKRSERKEQQRQPLESTSNKRARSSEETANKHDAIQSQISKERIRKISIALENVRRNLYGNGVKQIKLYNASTAAKTIAANKKRKLNRKWSEESIQPRSSDYSGIGLARKSLFIEFVDPSYFPKLEEEFREHIPGFFGKQRTKAMKRQMDGNMLWRQLQDKKTTMSKKLKNMNPDERVQAMIDSGLI
jgi:hypothetical protein